MKCVRDIRMVEESCLLRLHQHPDHGINIDTKIEGRVAEDFPTRAYKSGNDAPPSYLPLCHSDSGV